jgi:hypothetical protein
VPRLYAPSHVPLLIGACVLLSTPVPAVAQQQRLFAVQPGEVVELDPRGASVGDVLRRFRVPATPYGAVPFDGGRLLVGTDDGAIVLVDTQHGAAHAIRLPGFVAGSVLGTDGGSRLVVSGTNGIDRALVLVADARSGSVRFLDVGRIGSFPPLAYAPASDVVFVARPVALFSPDPRLVDVVHASTGTLLRSLDISPFMASRLSTNAAGTRLFVNASFATAVFDTAVGTQLAANSRDVALTDVPSSTMTLDEARNRLLVSVRPGVSGYESAIGISAFTADSLSPLGRMRVPELPLPSAGNEEIPSLTQEVDGSGLSTTVFVLQAVEVAHGKYYTTRTCHESQLMAVDADTGEIRRTVSTTAALGSGACRADLVRITEPRPPSAPTADLSGHRVTLAWQPSLGALRYEIEAGSAPGLTNLARISVTDSRFEVDGVPPGVYYLRVRAINAIGHSRPSGDTQVVVP